MEMNITSCLENIQECIIGLLYYTHGGNSDTLNTWATIENTSSGLSNSKTQTAHCATKMIETHGLIYYQRVNTHI